MPAKPETYFLTSATRRTASGSEFGYPTVEAALRAARVILGKDAELIRLGSADMRSTFDLDPK
jgi:hypothetical protein